MPTEMNQNAFLSRTRRMLAPHWLATLGKRRLLVAGCGGVGGAVALTLARMGLCNFVLADPGRFDEPDANRQWAADCSTLGENKAAVYGTWLKQIAAEIRVDVRPEGVTPFNVESLVEQADLVLDCLDITVDFSLRLRLFEAAQLRNIHVITAPVIGFGTVLVNASPTGVPMAEFFKIVADIMQKGFGPHFSNIFWPPSLEAIQRDIASGRVPSVSIGTAVGGAVASMEVVATLLADQGCRPPIMLPEVLVFDAMTMCYRKLSLSELAS